MITKEFSVGDGYKFINKDSGLANIQVTNKWTYCYDKDNILTTIPVDEKHQYDFQAIARLKVKICKELKELAKEWDPEYPFDYEAYEHDNELVLLKSSIITYGGYLSFKNDELEFVGNIDPDFEWFIPVGLDEKKQSRDISVPVTWVTPYYCKGKAVLPFDNGDIHVTNGVVCSFNAMIRSV